MSACTWTVTFWQPGTGALITLILDADDAAQAEGEARRLLHPLIEWSSCLTW